MIFRPIILLFAVMLPLQAVHAATAEEVEAAKETDVANIRLATTPELAPPFAAILNARGLKLAYVEQDTQPGGGQYFCGALAASGRAQIFAAAAKAFAVLPVAAWQKIGLKYVLLCSEARAGNQVIGGIPVPPIHLLMLHAGGELSHLQHLALHELYHLIEFQLGSYQDAEWNATFTGYAGSYNGRMKQSAIGDGTAGFINAYSETMAPEERAELFAFVLLQLADVKTHLIRTQDTVLAAKLAHLKAKMQQGLGVDIMQIGAQR